MKALITMLVLATSTAAFAQPAVVPGQFDQRYDDQRYDDRYDRRDDSDSRYDNHYDDNRYDGDNRFGRRMWMRRPVMLAQNVSLMRQWNRDHRPMLIDIDSRIGGLRRLRLDRIEGRMFVDDIMISFADGHQQRIEVNQVLSARNPSIMIDLDHGAVTALSVDGNTMRGRALFNIVGLRR